MTVDAQGGIWIAHWGAGCVSRFDPDGGRERWINLPASQITRPCFAGADYSRLFLTSASDGVEEPLAVRCSRWRPASRPAAPPVRRLGDGPIPRHGCDGRSSP
jgi:hypothetical protein